MNLTIVGSGTAAPEAERVCASLFLETPETRVLVDCGPGAVHHLARFGLPWPRLEHVLITHFHNDHIGDVAMLLFALKWGLEEPRAAPLDLWGPAGLGDRLVAMAAAFGDHVGDPGFPVRVHALEPGARAELARDLSLSCARTPHTPESLAYRFEGHGGSIGYTGDTGPSEDVARFLADVDLLVAECAVPDEEAMEIHLHPTALAAMARIASPAHLVITHVYPRLARRDVAGLVRAAGWTGAVTRATDGLRFDVPDPAR